MYGAGVLCTVMVQQRERMFLHSWRHWLCPGCRPSWQRGRPHLWDVWWTPTF